MDTSDDDDGKFYFLNFFSFLNRFTHLINLNFVKIIM